MRIAVWRGGAKDSTFGFRRLAAVSHDVAIVIPAAQRDAVETRSALDTADRVAGMLAELGLGSDAIDEEALVRGALGRRKVAVLAYNPGIGPAAVEELGRFVEAGGKLLVCYTLPGGLARILGIGNPQYVRPEKPGGFAQIHFDAPHVVGLPSVARQASWNITTAEAADDDVKVIGRWHDDQGKPTGHAAMLLGPNGAFFSHIVLGDDRPAKTRMLGAVLGHLAPSLWQQMSQAALDRAGRIGHCADTDEIVAYIRQHGNPAAVERLKLALDTLALAKKDVAAGDFSQATESANRVHAQLAEAYLLAQPSPASEGRAWWNHSGTGAYSGDWERTARELADAGFNMVLPNMLWGGLAHYPSDLLPRSGTFRQYGDQVAQCVAACHKHGIEVHVWKVNYNMSNAPRDFVAKMRAAGRTQVSADGKPHDWLCPSHPENVRLETESMLEVARKYDVDGIHFDYIRYPGSRNCFCDGCRGRFESERGQRVGNWPADCYSGALKETYTDWRCRQITKLVAAVHAGGKKLRPDLKISAAVFGSYPDCRRSVAQDWPVWVKAGYLDFLCPMDYTESDLYFRTLVANQLRLVGGRIPVYPGIGATASRVSLSADRVVGQIHHARSLGAAGFTIFNLHRGTIDGIAPGVGLGATATRATPPHGKSPTPR